MCMYVIEWVYTETSKLQPKSHHNHNEFHDCSSSIDTVDLMLYFVNFFLIECS